MLNKPRPLWLEWTVLAILFYLYVGNLLTLTQDFLNYAFLGIIAMIIGSCVWSYRNSENQMQRLLNLTCFTIVFYIFGEFFLHLPWISYLCLVYLGTNFICMLIIRDMIHWAIKLLRDAFILFLIYYYRTNLQFNLIIIGLFVMLLVGEEYHQIRGNCQPATYATSIYVYYYYTWIALVGLLYYEFVLNTSLMLYCAIYIILLAGLWKIQSLNPKTHYFIVWQGFTLGLIILNGLSLFQEPMTSTFSLNFGSMLIWYLIDFNYDHQTTHDRRLFREMRVVWMAIWMLVNALIFYRSLAMVLFIFALMSLVLFFLETDNAIRIEYGVFVDIVILISLTPISQETVTTPLIAFFAIDNITFTLVMLILTECIFMIAFLIHAAKRYTTISPNGGFFVLLLNKVLLCLLFWYYGSLSSFTHPYLVEFLHMQLVFGSLSLAFSLLITLQRNKYEIYGLYLSIYTAVCLSLAVFLHEAIYILTLDSLYFVIFVSVLVILTVTLNAQDSTHFKMSGESFHEIMGIALSGLTVILFWFIFIPHYPLEYLALAVFGLLTILRVVHLDSMMCQFYTFLDHLVWIGCLAMFLYDQDYLWLLITVVGGLAFLFISDISNRSNTHEITSFIWPSFLFIPTIIIGGIELIHGFWYIVPVVGFALWVLYLKFEAIFLGRLSTFSKMGRAILIMIGPTIAITFYYVLTNGYYAFPEGLSILQWVIYGVCGLLTIGILVFTIMRPPQWNLIARVDKELKKTTVKNTAI